MDGLWKCGWTNHPEQLKPGGSDVDEWPAGWEWPLCIHFLVEWEALLQKWILALLAWYWVRWPRLLACVPWVNLFSSVVSSVCATGLMVMILKGHLDVKARELRHVSGHRSRDRKGVRQGRWGFAVSKKRLLLTASSRHVYGRPLSFHPPLFWWPVSEGLLRSKDRANLKDPRPRYWQRFNRSQLVGLG